MATTPKPPRRPRGEASKSTAPTKPADAGTPEGAGQKPPPLKPAAAKSARASKVKPPLASTGETAGGPVVSPKAGAASTKATSLNTSTSEAVLAKAGGAKTGSAKAAATKPGSATSRAAKPAAEVSAPPLRGRAKKTVAAELASLDRHQDEPTAVAKADPGEAASETVAAGSPTDSAASEKPSDEGLGAESVAHALATPAGKTEVKTDRSHVEAAKKASGAKGPVLKPINLALQGGGAHGAFTWGVLDRLLEDGRIAIEGISGTSAGAMNAAVLATGLARDGNQGGREALDRYWRAVSKDGRTSPLQRTLLDRLFGNWSLNSNPSYIAFDMMSRFLSPYDFNPLNINPLMELIEQHVDFKALQACRHVHVFVSATNEHTGKVRVFARHELTPQAIMASACLPLMFQAVEIDGVPYWDGGFMGNPALFPLYNAVKTDDILLIQINPIIRRTTPKTARDIQDRMNEITFNASLLAQLRATDFVTRLLKRGNLNQRGDGIDGYRDLRLHRIDGAEKLIALDASTKMNAEWEFLTYLKSVGREAAESFLENHFDSIGIRSTLDVREELEKC